MRLLDNLISHSPRQVGKTAAANHASYFSYDGSSFGFSSMEGSKPDVSDGTFKSMVDKVHKKSGVVSAAVFARSLILSQVRFSFKQQGFSPIIDVEEHGQTPDLARLERPGSMTRPTMLKRMEQDVSYAGNAILVPGANRRLHRLPPHKVSFILGSNEEPTWDDGGAIMTPFDAEVKGLIYNPNENQNIFDNLKVFRPGQFCHWMPEPDPMNFWRGSSWVQSVLRDVALDDQIDDHQSKFFELAATPRMIFMADGTRTSDELKAAAASINDSHAGVANAHRNMFIGGISDVRVVGQDFSKIGFKDLEGSIEISVAMRSRVPASILGTRDSLNGSSLNAGNYSAARRMWSDGWFTPTVEDLCSSMECLAPPPPGKMLGADLSHVLFLQEDALDQANVTQTQMTAIRNAVDGGFDPASATLAVVSGDLTKLVHTGMVSVQLQPPGAQARAVMGRLGRATSVADINVDLLVKGLPSDTADIVRATLEAHPTDSIEDLRAAIAAVFQNGDT